jgi:hypothetical protein
VILNFLDGGSRDGIIATIVEIPSAGKTLEDVIQTFIMGLDSHPSSLSEWRKASNRVVLEIHALGRVTVRIKKVGRSWDPAPCTQDGYQPSTAKTFRLRNRGLVQTGLGATQNLTYAGVRYLVDVKLE